MNEINVERFVFLIQQYDGGRMGIGGRVINSWIGKIILYRSKDKRDVNRRKVE